MACPASCPGPRVPHHCKKLPASGSLREQIAALKSSVLKKRRSRHLPAAAVAAKRAAQHAAVVKQQEQVIAATSEVKVVDARVAAQGEQHASNASDAPVVPGRWADEHEDDKDEQDEQDDREEERDEQEEEQQHQDHGEEQEQHQEEEEEDVEEHKHQEALPMERTTSVLSVATPSRSQNRRQLPSLQLPLTDVKRAAAKQLFSAVAGVLNGAYHEVPANCVEAARQWLGELAEGEDEAVRLGTSGMSILLAANGLAVAVHSGAVPIPGLSVLASLQGPLRRLGGSCLLAEALVARLGWLAEQLSAGRVPFSQWGGLLHLRQALSSQELGENDLALLAEGAAQLLAALVAASCRLCQKQPPAEETCRSCKGKGVLPCARCAGSGRFKQPCRSCAGSGIIRRAGTRAVASCKQCQGTGQIVLGDCRACSGGSATADRPCPNCEAGLPVCLECRAQRLQEAEAEEAAQAERRRQAASQPRSLQRQLGPPPVGVTVARASASDLARLVNLWEERTGEDNYSDYSGCSRTSRCITAAWSLDNPLLSWHFSERRKVLKQSLGRDPDELDGFHGSSPQNFLSIVQGGFRSDLRSGQAFGSGEYFAKNPNVSVGYCRGGDYMLVCRLLFGFESSSQANKDGDHIWVESAKYYVISSPAQVLPLFLVRFADSGCKDAELEKVLSAGTWTTKKAEEVLAVPPNRPCVMSRESATVLWMGLLHAHLSDEQLEADVRSFFAQHAPAYTEGMKVQIVRGIFKKAHAILKRPMPRDFVHRLNKLPFTEGGQQRTICVEDAHGSPEQKCPKWIAKYCRGQNLRYTTPCWCWHPHRETDRASYSLELVDLHSAKGNEILSKFSSSAPFHDGQPRIVSIRAMKNPVLSRLHEEYRQYLQTKHREEPSVRELYHGTNNNIHDVLFKHGLQPPSDCDASDACPVSGGKGLCTTLCPNTCRFCTTKHEWGRCHMFGLGIYLADIAQKSHRYVSQPQAGPRGTRRYKMIICSVLGRAFKLEGHLRTKDAMHDVANVRILNSEDLDEMLEPCCAAARRPGRGGVACSEDSTADAPPEKSDLLFVQGLGSNCRPGSSVYNSEYIAYHPHQCLPKYEIEYEI
ncbi:unnamed protein product [Polarella glacialis]|uniref:PARP catalytic domain-containing protein n=2 Tax=Polarella glacialis TaxID=89957 RepID=A0A813IEH4_POLGL|nr:unnamed protein product [Polarella glacialis]